MRDETTDLSSPIVPHGELAVGSRTAFLAGPYPAAVPDPPRQCTEVAPHPDCPTARLGLAERTPCDPCLSPPRPGGSACSVPTAQGHPLGARRRTVAGAATRAAPRVWPTAPDVDTALSRRGLLGAGADSRPGQHRDHSARPQTVGRELAAGQALDHQP
jgi:hypothetical protein